LKLCFAQRWEKAREIDVASIKFYLR